MAAFLAYFIRERIGVSFCMMPDRNERLLRVITDRNRHDEDQEFQQFCEELLSVSLDGDVMPRKGFKADIELEPLRWMTLGIELIRSRRVTGHVQLAGGVEGPETGSYLPYPVFQAAIEVFLKGMWLSQFAECRQINDSSYVDVSRRKAYHEMLGSKGLGHDLLKIINAVREIREYATRPSTIRYLDLLERITRVFYFPPYEADKRTRWADARYPKRVYDDKRQRAHAESFHSFPRAEWIARILRELEAETDGIWQIRDRLLRNTATNR